jgi:LPS-assembly protein
MTAQNGLATSLLKTLFQQTPKFGLAAFVCGLLSWHSPLAAQVEPPDRRNLFSQDSKAAKISRRATMKAALQEDKPGSEALDVKAPQVQFKQEPRRVQGSGGVLISRAGLQAQAEDAVVELDTNQADLSGRVAITDAQASLLAEKGQFNFESETGSFSAAELRVEDGGYEIEAAELKRLSEYEYELTDTELSTCQCSDGVKPWRIHSSRAHLTQEGYAHTYGSWLEFHGVPLFYSPYLAFPLKSKRQSGLLTPDYGYSSRDGVKLRAPVFVTLGESADLLIAPFIQTQTRVGTAFDYRQAFSRNNNIKTRFIYSNEAQRDGDLRGTNTAGLFDPELKENRFGAYVSHLWTSKAGDKESWALVSDIHYINDDLFLREIQDEKIGAYNDRYTTSTILGRSTFGDYVSAEVLTEFNQSLVSDDDLTFQRLPQTALLAQKSFRPFGFNPYGVKFTTSGGLNLVNFARQEGYDGWRFDAAPGVAMPFHVKNYFNGRLELASHQTWYELDDVSVPGTTDGEIDASQFRDAYSLRFSANTGVERVYELDDGNWLSWLTAVGKENQVNRLTRLKHTIEPAISFTHVPDTASDSELPLFDSLDRLRARSLFTYGVKTNLYGRFLPKDTVQDVIPELMPEVEDVPSLLNTTAIGDIASNDPLETGGGNVTLRKGEIRPLVSLGIRQAYDYEEDKHDSRENDPKNDLQRTAFSDVNTDLTLYPSSNFALRAEQNIDPKDGTMSSWGLSTHVKDDRGDLLRARYTYIDEALSHVEGSAELVLTDRLRLGYYGRFDDREHEFIENRVGLRFQSSCNCWKVDLGVTDRINPDEQQVNLVFTLVGLGDFAQKFGLGGK